MILLFYLVIFTCAFVYRSRILLGRHLRRQTMEGAPYLEHLAWHGKHKDRVSACLGLTLEDDAFFVIRREKWYHRFLKNAGLASEVETGNAALDKTLFFMTDTPDHLKDLMAQNKFKDGVAALFRTQKIKSVHAFGKNLWVRCTTIPAEGLTQKYKTDRLKCLQGMADGLAVTQHLDSISPGWLTQVKIAVLFMAAHMAFLCLGVLAGLTLLGETVEVIDILQLGLYGALTALAAVIVWGFTILTAFKRSSWITLVAMDFILIGMIGLILSSVFLVREVNYIWDKSPPRFYSQPVVAKSCTLTCSRGTGNNRASETYTLTENQCSADARTQTLADYKVKDHKCGVRSRFLYKISLAVWLPEQLDDFVFSANSQKYDLVNRGDLLKVPLYAGALGLAWLDTKKINP